LNINRTRLKEEFLRLVKISSESKNEKGVVDYLIDLFSDIADEVILDGSKEKTGSNTDNLIIKIRGTRDIPPLLLCSHVDTVVPGNNITPIEEGDIIRTDGNTILGADCKSGVAMIIECVRSLKEHNADHGDIELLFTVCEEIGLLGAKSLDYSLIESRQCFAVDTVGVVRIINRAPSSDKIKFTIFGKEAHAGVEPEKGISAIKIAARAIELMTLGRIDHETTANIGTIQGGDATNIVPKMVVLKGEARSHDSDKLRAQTNSMRDAVKSAVAEYRVDNADDLPRYEEDVTLEYESFTVPEDDELITRCKRAAESMDEELTVIAAGGGSDANIFNAHGIKSVIFATGMDRVHTVNEQINMDDLYKNATLLFNVLLV